MNPVDEYFAVKQAGTLGDIGNALKPSLLGWGAQTALTGGLAAGVYGLRKAHLALTKKRDFDRMMEFNPNLQEARTRVGEKQFNQYFTSMRNMLPVFSRDPVTAGTLMEQMAGGATPGDVLQTALTRTRELDKPLHQNLMRTGITGPKISPLDLEQIKRDREQHAIQSQRHEWGVQDRQKAFLREQAEERAAAEAAASRAARSDLAEVILRKGVPTAAVGRAFQVLPFGDRGFRPYGESPDNLVVSVGRKK